MHSSLLPGQKDRQRGGALLHRKIVKTKDDPPQRVTFQGIGGQRLPSGQGGVQQSLAWTQLQAFNRARLLAEHVERGLAVAIQVHDAVHALLERSQAFVAHVRAVVVVVEENCPGNKIEFAADVGMVAQDFNAPGVAPQTFRCALTVAVFGDHHGLVGKGTMDFLKIALH